MPKEQDKPASEATDAPLTALDGGKDEVELPKPAYKQWTCGLCGLKFDKPIKIDGIDSCPNSECNSQHLIRLPLIPPKKRHRRTKAEILAMAQKNFDKVPVGFKNSDEADNPPELASVYKPKKPADIPIWKCTACGHKTDAPYKIIRGQFAGKWKCPSCGLKNTMVRNE